MQTQDVYFIDGVRTPFGKAGEKGVYWKTRADDLVVKAMIGLLERHPDLPKEAIDDVAIAAATQYGDQGLQIGRSASILAGLPLTVPGYSIDRWCAGAMTSVTTTASAIGIGAYDIALAGGVEHMGHHPMGEGADPNPRFLAEKLVDPRVTPLRRSTIVSHTSPKSEATLSPWGASRKRPRPIKRARFKKT